MTNNEGRRPVRVVVAGGGTAGWVAATALVRQLGSLIDLTLVESEEIGTIGVGESTVPTARAFHEFLKIDQQAFMRASRATFKLGISFENWAREGDRYIHSFGTMPLRTWTTEFQHFWLEANARGEADEIGAYYLEHEAARLHRMDFAGDPKLNYAFHVDASLYARFLRKIAEADGCTRKEGKIARVEQDGESGNIAALIMEDGTRIEGDLFIDCTGFRSVLLGQTLETPFEDWLHWLPNDSAWATQMEGTGEAYPYTRAIAHGAGWQWRIPLQHRLGAGFVFSSDHLNADEALSQFHASMEGRPLRDPFLIKFRGGRRRSAWVKNCIGIGLAGGFVEPLESTTIHLIMIAVTRVLQLFPFGPDQDAQRKRFNEMAQTELERIRDFIVLHYHLTERDDTSFWNHVRTMSVPDSLRERMEIFAESAIAWQSTEEIFRIDSWIQVLLGQRMTPKSWHRLAQLMAPGRLRDTLADIRTRVDRRVASMPSHQAFIDDYCGEVPA
jgi:tryptophan halogenase